MRRPHFGHTRHGLAVHLHVFDHLPEGTAYQRVNKKAAVWLTRNVGTMTCFWIFWILCLFVLPSCLQLMNVIHWHFFLALYGFNFLATWFLSTTLELTLMPAIMVGQNIQNEASDARSAKQFEDTEVIADRLDTSTKGGITDVLAAIGKLSDDVASLAEAIRARGGGT